MKNRVPVDDLSAEVIQRLLAAPEEYFGRSTVLAITPTSITYGRNSTILRATVVLREDRRQNICIKTTKLKKRSPEQRELWRRRIQTEYDVAQLVHDGFREHTDEFTSMRPVACFPDDLVLVTEECPGTRLMTVLERKARFFPSGATESRLARYCFLSGRWLRILRDLTKKTDETFRLSELVDYVDTRLRKVVHSPVIAIDEQLRRTVLQFFRAQEPYLKDGDLTICGVTGDFVPANVLAHERKITVLDFGMYRHGSMYQDLSQYYQHLEFFLQKPIYRRKTIARLQREFLRGYDPGFDAANPLFRLFRIRAMINRLAATAVRKWSSLPVHVRVFNRAAWRAQISQLRRLEQL